MAFIGQAIYDIKKAFLINFFLVSEFCPLQNFVHYRKWMVNRNKKSTDGEPKQKINFEEKYNKIGIFSRNMNRITTKFHR